MLITQGVHLILVPFDRNLWDEYRSLERFRKARLRFGNNLPQYPLLLPKELRLIGRFVVVSKTPENWIELSNDCLLLCPIHGFNFFTDTLTKVKDFLLRRFDKQFAIIMAMVKAEEVEAIFY
jgi:hypothetical protein